MMVSAGIAAFSFATSGMRSAKAAYPGDVRSSAGPATRTRTSTRSSHPVGRRSLALLTTRGVLALRRCPFRLRGQSIWFMPLSLPTTIRTRLTTIRTRLMVGTRLTMVRTAPGGGHDRAIPADRLRAEERADFDQLAFGHARLSDRHPVQGLTRLQGQAADRRGVVR